MMSHHLRFELSVVVRSTLSTKHEDSKVVLPGGSTAGSMHRYWLPHSAVEKYMTHAEK
jgi:hypothetical protein